MMTMATTAAAVTPPAMAAIGRPDEDESLPAASEAAFDDNEDDEDNGVDVDDGYNCEDFVDVVTADEKKRLLTFI
jgi:hypothetical protein